MMKLTPTAVGVVALMLAYGPASAQTMPERPEPPAAKERAPGPPSSGQDTQDRQPGKDTKKQQDKGRSADAPEKGQKQSEPKGKRKQEQAQPDPTTTPKSDRGKDATRQDKADVPSKDKAEPKTKADRGPSPTEPKRAEPKGTRQDGPARAEPKTMDPAQPKSAQPKAPDPATSGQARTTVDGQQPRIQVTEEQRTRVREAFPRDQLQRSTRVNFSVSVGVRVPRTVELYAIPASVVSIAPAYRSYRYIVVDEQICIVDPATYVVVDVIEVRSSRPSQAVALDLTETERAILIRYVDWDRARTDITVDLALGADIPERVRLYEFTRDVTAEIPKLANYRYIVTGRDIVIVEPKSRDIALVVRN